MQMVDDTIFPLVDKSAFSVKVKPTRASKRSKKEVSASVAGRSHSNVNTRGVPTIAYREDSVTPTGLQDHCALGSKRMVARVPTGRKRVDSVCDMERELGCAHVGSDDNVAPHVTPWVTLGSSSGAES
jgi:hypothetical protein